jgi:hypothetical protein
VSFIGDPEEWPNPNSDMAIAETAMARPDVETDTRAIAERIFDRMAERFPGWIARDGNLETWLIEEFSAVTAEIRQEAITVPEAIYQTYGEEVLGIPATPSAPALADSVWTAIDNLGYRILAGTQLTLTRSGDAANPVAFEVVATVEIPPGEMSIGGVQIRAIQLGEQGNRLFGEAELIDPLFWVDSVEVPIETANGVDGQTLEEYLESLIALMRIVAIRPILPFDFATLALRVPGVTRAVAMDGYDPGTETWGHARTITLILMNPEGKQVSQPTRDTVRNTLEQLREVNFIVNVIDAEYETVNVSYTVTAFAEQDPEVVRVLCDAAIRDSLSPAQYRLGLTSPSIAVGEVIPPPGVGAVAGRRIIRVNDFIGLLDRQRGVDFVQEVLIDGSAIDLELPKPFTLPEPGDIEGTVNLP